MFSLSSNSILQRAMRLPMYPITNPSQGCAKAQCAEKYHLYLLFKTFIKARFVKQWIAVVIFILTSDGYE